MLYYLIHFYKITIFFTRPFLFRRHFLEIQLNIWKRSDIRFEEIAFSDIQLDTR